MQAREGKAVVFGSWDDSVIQCFGVPDAYRTKGLQTAKAAIEGSDSV